MKNDFEFAQLEISLAKPSSPSEFSASLVYPSSFYFRSELGSEVYKLF